MSLFLSSSLQTKKYGKTGGLINDVIYSTFTLCLVGVRYCVSNYENEIDGNIVFVLE